MWKVFACFILCLAVCQCRRSSVCSLPKKEGPCYALERRFYYDSALRSCRMFFYGGCKGNGNQFLTKRRCRKTCVEPICSLPKDEGPCYAKMDRYYYDSTTKSCRKFPYGGCKGNENRFFTEQQCRNACHERKKSTVPVCSLPKDERNCGSFIPRFYYDSTTKSCRSFIYRGCEGNGNRFLSDQECRKACVEPICSLPKKEGSCTKVESRYYYDSNTKSCRTFIYSGCKGNENRFLTKQQCLKTCLYPLCTLPKKEGPCYAYNPSYYYNSTTNSCHRFIYGGCKGNGNRFLSKQQCQDACVGSVCSLPKDDGTPCHMAIQSYYYDSTTKSCRVFFYGGCKGNGNRFSSDQECRKTCVEPLCSLPKVEGPCFANKPRFYYDSTTKSCRKFNYGGCQGNGNRFLSKQQCRDACDEVCNLPLSSGNCKASMPRYFYNKSSTPGCVKFNYGGCGGNANNFLTKEACLQRCRGRIK